MRGWLAPKRWPPKEETLAKAPITRAASMKALRAIKKIQASPLCSRTAFLCARALRRAGRRLDFATTFPGRLSSSRLPSGGESVAGKSVWDQTAIVRISSRRGSSFANRNHDSRSACKGGFTTKNKITKKDYELS